MQSSRNARRDAHGLGKGFSALDGEGRYGEEGRGGVLAHPLGPWALHREGGGWLRDLMSD
jgi:hypothetical protein